MRLINISKKPYASRKSWRHLHVTHNPYDVIIGIYSVRNQKHRKRPDRPANRMFEIINFSRRSYSNYWIEKFKFFENKLITKFHSIQHMIIQKNHKKRLNNESTTPLNLTNKKWVSHSYESEEWVIGAGARLLLLFCFSRSGRNADSRIHKLVKKRFQCLY